MRGDNEELEYCCPKSLKVAERAGRLVTAGIDKFDELLKIREYIAICINSPRFFQDQFKLLRDGT